MKDRVITIGVALAVFGTLAYMTIYIAMYGVYTGSIQGVI